jgi:hypothetical protein
MQILLLIGLCVAAIATIFAAIYFLKQILLILLIMFSDNFATGGQIKQQKPAVNADDAGRVLICQYRTAEAERQWFDS